MESKDGWVSFELNLNASMEEFVEDASWDLAKLYALAVHDLDDPEEAMKLDCFKMHYKVAQMCAAAYLTPSGKTMMSEIAASQLAWFKDIQNEDINQDSLTDAVSNLLVLAGLRVQTDFAHKLLGSDVCDV